MAAGSRPQPANGLEKIAAKVTDLQRQIDSLRTAAGIRNSSISGGSGLTVREPSGQTIQLKVSDDGTSRLLFTPPTATQVEDWAAFVAFDPDGSYGGGELVLQSPGAPVGRFDNVPLQQGFINLTSGDAVIGVGSVGLSVTNFGLQVLDAGFGNPARIVMGSTGSISHVEEDATSWRLLVGNAGLVFPQSIAEVRVRSFLDSAYVPIRASAFTVTSTREAKQDIRDLGWSATEVVANARAHQYRYQDAHADPDRLHFGPMAEDLPAELVDNTDPDLPALDLATLVGVLWGAVGELTARVKELECAAGRDGR